MSEERGQVLSSEDVYTGRVFTVKRDRVRLPSGIEATMEVVRAPGIGHSASDAGSGPSDPHQAVSLCHRSMDLGTGCRQPRTCEDPYTGAVRECEEEIGLRPGHVFEIGNLYPTPGYCDEKTFFKLTELALRKRARRSLSRTQTRTFARASSRSKKWTR